MTAFPSITAVTHAFASNEDPLGSPWLGNTYTGGTTTLLKSVSGVALKGPISSTGFGMQVHGTTFGPDIEMWQKVVTVTATNAQEIFANFLRLQQDGAATVDGYVVYAELAAGTDTWHIDRINNGSQTNIANGTQDITAGGWVGAKIEDSGGNPVITGYWCPSANDPTLTASWTQVVTFTDSSGSKITGTGRCGLECQGVVTTFDDLRVGTIVTGGTDGTATTPAATGLGDFPAPAFQAGSTVTTPAADALGDFPDSQMLIGSDVTAPAALVFGDFPVPTVTGTGDSTVTAPAATGLGDFPAPATQWGNTVTVPAHTALGDFPVPTVTGTVSATVTAVPADATGDFPVPTVSDGSAGTVTPHYDTPTTFDLDAHDTTSELTAHTSTFELTAHDNTSTLTALVPEFALDA